MAQKRREESSFTVTDRRLFNAEGELRSDIPEEVEAPKPATPDAAAPANVAQQQVAPPEAAPVQAAPVQEMPAPVAGAATDREMPIPPTSAEQDAQAAAYRASSKDL